MVPGLLNRLLWVLILENKDMHSHSFKRPHVPFTLVHFTFIPSWTNSSKKLPHVMQGIRIKESRKFLLVESGIRERFLVESGILAGIQLKESRNSSTICLLTYFMAFSQTGVFWSIYKERFCTLVFTLYYSKVLGPIFISEKAINLDKFSFITNA